MSEQALANLKRERDALRMYEEDFYRVDGNLGHQVTRAIEAMTEVLGD